MKISSLFTAVSLLCAQAAIAALEIQPTGVVYTYVQDFDGMFMPANPGNDSGVWNDGVTVPGWLFHFTGNSATAPAGVFAGANFTYTGSDGSVAPQLTLNSIGAAGSADRAMAMPSTTARCEQSGIVVFHNPRPNPVDLTSIRYTGEVRRTNSTANVVETIFPYYRTGASEAAVLTMTTESRTAAQALATFPAAVATIPTAGNFLTGWTPIPAANFTFNSTVAATPTNDSLPVNALALSGIRVAPGEYMAVRFSNINDAGTDALMGMDDLQIEFIERTTTISAVASGIVRNDRGTPLNPDDDTIGFSLTVSHTGPVGPVWTLGGIPGVAGSGSYNTLVTFGGIPISNFATAPNHTLTASVRDSQDTTVSASFSITAPWCNIGLQFSGFHYDYSGGNSVTDHRVRVNAVASGRFTGATALLSYGIRDFPPETATMTYDVPLALEFFPGSRISFTAQDSSDPACTATQVVQMPAAIGFNYLNRGIKPIVSLPALGERAWFIDTTPVIYQSNATQVDHELLSEVMDLTSEGSVLISAEVTARTGTSSGFEAADHFRMDAIIDGETFSMLGSYDVDANGLLEGGVAGSGSELPDTGLTNVTKNFICTIEVPATANAVQIRIVGNSNSASETFTVERVEMRNARPLDVATDTMHLHTGASGKKTVASLVALGAGGDGPLTLSGVASSAVPGAVTGTVSIEEGLVIYTPPSGFSGIDAFRFTLTDGNQSVTSQVTVFVDAPGGATENVARILREGAGNRVAALGIPGRYYVWEFSADLLAWSPLGRAVQCPASGVVTLLDAGPLPPTRFYRMVEGAAP